MATKRTGSRYKKKEILELKKVFDSHDADGSGSVSVSELKQHLTTSALGSGDFVKVAEDSVTCLTENPFGLGYLLIGGIRVDGPCSGTHSI